ncbi:MAG: hypothetical protein R3A44_44005 [Caldilineaceae bacterium]
MLASTDLVVSCPNEACVEFGKPLNARQHFLQKFGFTVAGSQRYICRACGKTFSEQMPEDATLFAKRKIPIDAIMTVMVEVAIRRTPILRASRQTGHKQASILAWVREIGEHLERVDSVEMVNRHLREKNGVSETELQLFWEYVKEKDAKRRTAHR